MKVFVNDQLARSRWQDLQSFQKFDQAVLLIFCRILESSFLVGDEIKTGAKGDFIFVPRNTRHAFRVDTETAAFLNGYTPSGLELAVTELAMPAPSRTIPPKGATPPPPMTPELMRRYGMDNLPGPNPLALDPH